MSKKTDFTKQIKTKEEGFIGAIMEYNVGSTKIAVGFTLDRAYVLYDEDGVLMDIEDLIYNINEFGMEIEQLEDILVIADIEGVSSNISQFDFTQEQIDDVMEKLEYLQEIR